MPIFGKKAHLSGGRKRRTDTMELPLLEMLLLKCTEGKYKKIPKGKRSI